MADEQQTGQAPANDAQQGQENNGADSSVPEWASDPNSAYAEVQKARREAADTRVKLREIEKQLQESATQKQLEEEKQMQEQNKWQELAEKRAQELQTLQQQMQDMQSNMLRTQIAAEFKLPAELAKRLQGSSEDELREDAQALSQLIQVQQATEQPPAQQPQQQQQPRWQNNITPAAPGGKPVSETDAQRFARLYGRNNASAAFRRS